MIHIATIQAEFVKEARQWNKMTLEQQRKYLRKHPESKRRLTAKPKSKLNDIAKKLDRAIKHTKKEIGKYTDKDHKQVNKKDRQEVNLYKKDIRDYEKIKKDIIHKDFEKAVKRIQNQDTVASDEIPQSVHDFLDKETSRAKPNKIKKHKEKLTNMINKFKKKILKSKLELNKGDLDKEEQGIIRETIRDYKRKIVDFEKIRDYISDEKFSRAYYEAELQPVPESTRKFIEEHI